MGEKLRDTYRVVLTRLSGTMGLDAASIGRAITDGECGGFRAVGAGVLGRLRLSGLVTRVDGLWRLTTAGRQALDQNGGEHV